MKNVINVKVFASAVKAKVERADAMGTKTSWDTADHLRALAQAVAEATDPHYADAEDKGAAYVESIVDVLADGYNVSQFQQVLAKIPAYAAKGYFARGGRGPTSASDLYAALGVETKG